MHHLQTLPEELFALLSKAEGGAAPQQIRQIPVSAILPSPHQPRHTFDPEELRALAQSINTCGILQPLVVSQWEGQYYLVAGERRDARL